MNHKILFLLHSPPPVHGAAIVGNYIKESSRVNDLFDTRYINIGTSTSIEEIGKSGVAKFFRYMWLLWQVAVQMLIFRPQKVYLTLTAKCPGFYKDSVVVLMAKMLGGSFIYHFHNKGVQTRQHKPIDNWLYRKVFNKTEVILLSEYLYPDIEKYVPRERVYICPNGIPDQMSSTVESQRKSHDEPVQLLFLSNLIESKGVFVLLGACLVLKEKGLSFKCVLVGDEGDISADHLNKEIEKLGLEKEVAYVGTKYHKEKEEVITASDIFVHPSYNDCFPLVLLEAMQAKLPIVSTHEGGIPDMVEDGVNGYIVSQKDSQALAERLKELIENPLKREEMGQKGYVKYRMAFTLQAFEQRFTDILIKLI